MNITKTPEDLFIEHVNNVCEENGFLLVLENKKSVKSGFCMCSGYFSDEDQEIVIAWKCSKKRRFSVLAHEFCHLMQYIDQSEEYVSLKETVPYVDVPTIIDLWIAHYIELNEQQIEEYVTMLQKLEHDCEKRALKLIDEFDLPIDKEYYSKWANAYVFFYSLMKRDRVWFKSAKKSNVTELLKAAPSELLNDVSEYKIGKYDELEYEWKKLYLNMAHKKAP